AKLNALQTSLEEALSAKKATENKLEWTEKQLEDVKAHLDELNKQMNSVSSSGKDASAERFQKEAQQLKNRCNYMEMQYKELELKLAESNKQLEQRQKELEDMSKITGTIESSLKEQKDTDSAERDMLTSNISQLNLQLSTALGTIETLRAELSSVQQQLAGQQETSSLKELDWNEQKTALEKRLVVIQVEVDEWRGKHAAAFGDWERANQTVEELRQNYNEELEQLRATNFKLADLELLVQDKSNALTVALERADALQAELDQQMATRGQSETDMRTEIASLTERITDLQQKNDSLYEQLQKLGNEVAVLEKFSGEGPVSSDAAVDSTQSVQALNEVLHYLREEKQQAVQRADNSEAETKRLKSRVDLLESDFSALEVKLNAAEKDAMAASEAMAEKAELTLRLQTLEGTQETNRQLTAQIDALNSNIAELVAKGALLEERLSMADGERKSLQTQLTNAALDVEKMKTELSVWQTRHRELLEQQTQFGPDVVNELRTKLEAAERQASALQAELSRNTDELSKTKKQSDDHTDERDTIKSQLLDLRNQHEELTEKFAKNDQILDQARKLARKYKTQATQLEGTVKENETQIETQAKELAEIKAKLAETEKKLTETAAAGPSALPEADKITNPKVRQLVERLKAFETQQGNLKQTAQEMAKRAMDAIKEKREIEQKFNEAQKKIAELEDQVKNNGQLAQWLVRSRRSTKVAEEQSMRLQSLTSLHQQCEPKIHQLEADVACLNEEKTAMQQRLNLLQQQQQLQQQKAAQIVQHVQPSQLMSAGSSTSSAAAVAQKRAIVRPGGNPSPNVASVRPISSQQRPQQPTAVSPSATQPQPDQSSSSSSSSTMAAQASVAPIVVSTTQYPAIVQPAVSSVPHAFVLPHVEYQQQQDVSGSGDSGAISSSNQPLDNNGEHSRKRALPSQSDDQSSETAKRLRASPMEQVSTSDQGPSHEDLEEEPDLVIEQGADSVETTYHDEERDSEEGAALSDDDAEDVEDRDDVEEVEEVIDDEQVEEDEGDDEMMEGEAEYDEDDDEQDEAELIGEDGQLVMERREPSLHQQDDDDDDIQIVDHVPAGGHRAMMAASSSSMGVGEGVGANEFDLQTVPPPMRGGMIQASFFVVEVYTTTHGGHDDRLLNVDDSIVPSTPTLMGARRPEIDITTAAVPQSSRFVFQLPQQDIGHSHPLRADLVTESGIQQSVPTSRDVSPVHVGVESDSTVGSLAAEHHGQQEEPQDQMVVEDELTDHGDDADDAAGGEQEEDIGAVEAEYLEPDEQDEGPVDERPSQTEDDSAEPSTSGQRIRIRKPIVWSNLGEESQPTSSSSEQLQGQPSGRGRGQQTARRATRARKSWQRPT
uniref:Nucleoprotein TPR n=1 Tax=Plectus sambesii TaxID=2011161 RepID=A0A914WDH8_9BILA